MFQASLKNRDWDSQIRKLASCITMNTILRAWSKHLLGDLKVSIESWAVPRGFRVGYEVQ